MQAFLAKLKTQKPDPQIKLNEKRSNFSPFFQAFILTCGPITRIVQCRDFLGTFIQAPGISLIDYINTFDSVCWPWHQLLRSIVRKEFFKASVKQKAPTERHHKQSQIRPPSPHGLSTPQHHADNLNTRVKEAAKRAEAEILRKTTNPKDETILPKICGCAQPPFHRSGS